MSEVQSSPTLPLPPPKSGLQRIVGVLFNPGPTFEDIARKPDVLAPILVIVILAYVGLALTYNRMDFDAMLAQQQEIMREKNPNLSQAQLEQMERMQRSGMKFMGYFIWAAPLMTIILTVIVAGVLLLAFRLFGGQGNFMQAWSASLYAWIPRALYGIIVAIVIVARGKVNPMELPVILKSSPAFLVDMKTSPGLFSLLSSFEVFALWTLVLLILGFAALSKVSKGKAAAIIISLWLFLVLIKSGGAALMGRMRAS